MTAVEEIRLLVDDFFEELQLEVDDFIRIINERLDELAAEGGVEPHDYTE